MVFGQTETLQEGPAGLSLQPTVLLLPGTGEGQLDMFGDWCLKGARSVVPEKEVVVSGLLHEAEISVTGGGGEDPGEPGQ